YTVSTTTSGTDARVKSLIPNLTLQIGGEEIPSVHTHTIDFTVESGPPLETADVAITFSPGLRLYGKDAEAPSPLHQISCSEISDGVRCTLSPLTPKELNKYQVTLATNQQGPPRIIVANNRLKLLNLEDFLSQSNLKHTWLSTGAISALGIFIAATFLAI